MSGDAPAVPRIDHRHPPETTALVLGLAVLTGLYARWLVADLGIALATFLVSTGLVAYLLYARPTPTAMVADWLTMVAALLVATPVFMNLSFLVAARGYGVDGIWRFVLAPADLVFLVAFGVLAAVPAGLAAWLRRRA